MECKYDYLDGAVAGLWELIDTLWNVNIETICEGIDLAGINRYIMECK